MTLDEKVDIILKRMADGRAVAIYTAIETYLNESSDYKKHGIIVRYLEEKNLVKYNETNRSHAITGDGYKIVEAGGWVAYLASIDLEKQELKTFREREATATARRHRTTTILTIVGLFLIALPIYLGNKTYWQRQEIDRLTQEKERLSKALVYRDNLLRTKEATIQQMSVEIKRCVSQNQPSKPVK